MWTHVEDFVESVRAMTPAGMWESRRLPGSGAGPSPDRMLAGSEGALGVITEAWVRVQPRPVHRRAAAVRFADFARGAECVRALVAQSGLNPANCRLIDAREARMTLAGDGQHALLVLGFESADHPVDAPLARALAICAEHGGEARERGTGGAPAVGAARAGMLAAGSGAVRAPVAGAVRAGMPAAGRGTVQAPGRRRSRHLARGVPAAPPTCATCSSRWACSARRSRRRSRGSASPPSTSSVTAAAAAALREAGAQDGAVSCRFTHVYPDGPAPYYTVLARGPRGEEVEQWAAIKRAASDAVLAAGGTITHHHAVGPRPPALVRPPASGALRAGAARRARRRSIRAG